MAFVGASFASVHGAADRERVAVDLVGLRGEIGFFLDRHGMDVSDEVWSSLITTMHELDGTIAALGPVAVGLA